MQLNPEYTLNSLTSWHPETPLSSLHSLHHLHPSKPLTGPRSGLPYARVVQAAQCGDRIAGQCLQPEAIGAEAGVVTLVQRVQRVDPTCLGVVDQGTHPGAAQHKSSPVVLGVHFNLRPDRASFTMDLILKHCLRDHLALSGCFLHLFVCCVLSRSVAGLGADPDRQIACKAPNELRWSWTWHRRSSHHHPNLEEWLRHADNRQVRKSVDKSRSWANDSAWCLF